MFRRARLRLLFLTLLSYLFSVSGLAQINTDRMLIVGRNALFFEDYVLSIQYFNQVISAKPFLYEPYFYRAVAKLSLEDYVGAEEDCSQSIRRNPFIVDSYQVRGLARINQGKYKEAIEDYRKGLLYEPENTSLLHNYIYCLIQEKLFPSALSVIDTLLSISPDYSPAMSMRSEILWNNNDSAGAIQWLDRAIASDKYNPVLYHERGIMWARMEQYVQSEDDITHSIYLEPDNSTYYVNRALVRYYRNNLRGALSDYDLAISVDDYNTLAYYNRGLLRAQVGDDNRAIEDFDVVIKREPYNYMALFNRGLLRSSIGDDIGAVSDYSKVLDEYPDFIQGYSLRSEARYRLGDRAGGDADQLVVMRYQTRRFNNIVSGAADDADSTDDGKTRNKSDKNVRNYKKIVVTDDTETAAGYYNDYRGKVQNRNFEARYLPLYHLSYLRKVSEIDRRVRYSAVIDKLNDTASLLSRLYVSNTDISLSESQISDLFRDVDDQSKSINDNPNEAVYYFLRAVDFFHLQDFSSSESDFSAAVSRDSEFWAAYFCRAVLRTKVAEIRKSEIMDNGNQELDYQLVLNDLTKVVELEPEFVYAYYNRATIEAMLSDYRAALADFDKVLSLDAEFAEAYYNRGLTLIFLNRTDEAIKDLSKAGELGIYSAYNIIKRFSSSD